MTNGLQTLQPFIVRDVCDIVDGLNDVAAQGVTASRDASDEIMSAEQYLHVDNVCPVHLLQDIDSLVEYALSVEAGMCGDEDVANVNEHDSSDDECPLHVKPSLTLSAAV